MLCQFEVNWRLCFDLKKIKGGGRVVTDGTTPSQGSLPEDSQNSILLNPSRGLLFWPKRGHTYFNNPQH